MTDKYKELMENTFDHDSTAELDVRDIYGHKLYNEDENETLLIKVDAVNHPEHYNRGKYETIDVIEEWGLDFHCGNAIKYISRHKHKGQPKKDIEKAIWYLQRYLENM